MGKTALILALAMGVALVLYLSWLPQPQLGALGWLPRWLTRWTDTTAHGNLRTGVPFVPLGLLLGGWHARRGHRWPRWLGSWAGLAAVVLVAEGGQLWLPHRSFDPADIAWGVAGSAAGLGLGWALSEVSRRIKR